MALQVLFDEDVDMLAMMATVLIAFAGSPHSCRSIQGWEAVSSRESIRWLVVGEAHGTNEMPAVFADLVCLESRHKPVTVAVEQAEADQLLIDAYLESDGGRQAKIAFLTASMWRIGQPESVKDGRSSTANFELFEFLRQMHQLGRVSRVIAFEPTLELNAGTWSIAGSGKAGVDISDFEHRMADVLLSKAPSSGKILVFTGTAHARLMPMQNYPMLKPMASYLPRDQTATIQLVSEGAGAAWNCLESGCGFHATTTRDSHRRGIVMEPGAAEPYSASLYLGQPTTASPPRQPL